MIESFQKILQYESLFVAFVTAITTFVAIWYRNRVACKNHIRTFEDSTKRNEDIITSLEFIMKTFNADRAYVFEFHNGSYFSSGLPMQKFSCTYESVSDGISSECSNPGEYRISNFNEYIRAMLKHGHFWCPSLEGLQDYGLKAILSNKGVKSLYNVPIKTPSGKTIGFLGIDYVKNDYSLTEEEKVKLKQQARSISGYLSH